MFACFNMYHHLSQAALGYCEGKRQRDGKEKVKYDSYAVLKSEVREIKTNTNNDNNKFS